VNTVDLLRYHRSLVTDVDRLERFRRAVEKCVKAGDVVIDLGSGTGVLTVLAARAGARLVYAVEASEIMEIARRVCRENGVDDRVVFLDDLSPCVNLPEPADVLLTETIGNFGLDEGILGWVRDARRRLLKPGALIVPQSIELFAVPVENPESYQRDIDWNYKQAEIDLSPMRTFTVNNIYRERIRTENFLAQPCSLGKIRLDSELSTAFAATMNFEVSRPGILHGISGWFSAQLCEGLNISNHPRSSPGSWSHFFMPIETSLAVEPGDRLNARVSCSDNGSVWRWELTASSKSIDAQAAACGQPRFDQSTFFGAPRVARHLHKQAAGYSPGLNSDGKIMRYVLSLMDTEHTLEDLSVLVAENFPDRFSDSAEALEHVRSLSTTFGS